MGVHRATTYQFRRDNSIKAITESTYDDEEISSVQVDEIVAAIRSRTARVRGLSDSVAPPTTIPQE